MRFGYAIAALLLVGCGSAESRTSITVSAAASLTGAFTEIADEFARLDQVARDPVDGGLVDTERLVPGEKLAGHLDYDTPIGRFSHTIAHSFELALCRASILARCVQSSA